VSKITLIRCTKKNRKGPPIKSSPYSLLLITHRRFNYNARYAAAQCIVISPVCVCLWVVGLLPR